MKEQTFKNALAQRLRAVAAGIATAALLLVPALAAAQGNSASHASAQGLAHRHVHHVSSDLGNVVNGGSLNGVRWGRDTSKGRLVQVIITADSKNDRSMAQLRRAIVQLGGSVYGRYESMGQLFALLPASIVSVVAARADVVTVAPNRSVMGTASFLEQTTGVADVRNSVGVAPALDGTGIGIAILDSGIMRSHAAFNDASGHTRVVARADLTGLSPNWTLGVDTSGTISGGGGTSNPDPYGHGTFVASVAAGANVGYSLNSTGVAPGASLVDVRVLDGTGQGDLATALAGMDWIMSHATDYNIKVLNVSLGADSSDSYQDDPFCTAVRTAVAAGITVVVAAGNYGVSSTGKLIYGSISSPGDEPSAITVGSMNSVNTVYRGDDTVNNFSSKGPTRGAYVDSNNVTQYDNLLKPDLVAPGNRVVGAVSNDSLGLSPSVLSLQNPLLILQSMPANRGLMIGSGTSYATPAVAGAAALLLQANPGLTPPLIKAILQYTAQPVGYGNLVQQGTGLLNVPGAVAVAQSLSPTIASQVASGSINVGDNLLAPGKQLPPPVSFIGGQTVHWSQFTFMGGAHVLYGSKLLTQYQAVYDPTLLWVGNTVDVTNLTYAANGSVSGSTSGSLTSGSLLTAGVTSLDATLGTSDPALWAGIFTPSAYVLGDVGSGLGFVFTNGLTLSQTLVLAETMVLSEGIVVPDTLVSAETLIFSESLIASETLVLTEGGPVQIGGYSMAGE
jgi:subtilisin family serine protease